MSDAESKVQKLAGALEVAKRKMHTAVDEYYREYPKLELAVRAPISWSSRRALNAELRRLTQRLDERCSGIKKIEDDLASARMDLMMEKNAELIKDGRELSEKISEITKAVRERENS